jgi:hypothetical protein
MKILEINNNDGCPGIPHFQRLGEIPKIENPAGISNGTLDVALKTRDFNLPSLLMPRSPHSES